VSNDICVICGKYVPEGWQVCTECIRNAETAVSEEDLQNAEQLRDIAAILNITAGTDTNIKAALQGILNIADRLERRGKINGIF
jgi:predicted nucleic acid-binding Zn ribbon protein